MLCRDFASPPRLANMESNVVGEVVCPICQAKVPTVIINKHIDSDCKVSTDIPVPVVSQFSFPRRLANLNRHPLSGAGSSPTSLENVVHRKRHGRPPILQ